MVEVERLPHGYTNLTREIAGCVEKTYEGQARHDNARRERACLLSLRHRLPVATVLDADLSIPRLTLSLMPGVHGQELIAGGHARHVLRLVGTSLRALQAVPRTTVPDLVGDGPVIVHGDYGPQNMLFDLKHDRVTAILDWESAHKGDPVEDLAWAEWQIRMHHPDAITALGALFGGAQQRPPWSVRHNAMLKRVRALLAYCEASQQPSDWPRRLDLTQRWTDD
jgi:hypothetical protein